MAKKKDAAAPAKAQAEIHEDTSASVDGQNMLGDLRLRDLRGTAAKLWLQSWRHPMAFIEESAKLSAQVAEIIASGGDNKELAADDPRFSDSAWRSSGLYNRWMQAYFAWSQALQGYADRAGLDAREAGRAKFLLSQVSEALAPTNFLLGNPKALKRALESGGASLLDGYHNWLSDVTARRPVPSQVDSRPFKVGENLAATPGDVVMRTDMFELLQDAPQTAKVHERPILVIPSIINKYYAFDLAPGRSLLEYLVKNGFTLFVMVHRNPGREHDGWGMDAYMDALDQALRAGFTPMITPTIVNPNIMRGTGFLGEHADEIYYLNADDQFLVGTSEVALAGYHSDEIIDLESGPKRYAGWSACYRREAGSHGKDVRGIIRVHQFHKVEMFSYCKIEDAAAEHARLLGWEEEMLKMCELPYRVIDTAAGDLGSSAARKFDCEAWLPTQDRYLELTSTSNCTTYQARRLNIRERVQVDGKNETRTVATLNGTLATTRWIVAILENHQQPDGSVHVPVGLRPYLGGLEVLAPIK